jgi:hypothetical protein
MRIDVVEERTKGAFASNRWIAPAPADPACGSVVTVENFDGHYGDISSIMDCDQRHKLCHLGSPLDL